MKLKSMDTDEKICIRNRINHELNSEMKSYKVRQLKHKTISDQEKIMDAVL